MTTGQPISLRCSGNAYQDDMNSGRLTSEAPVESFLHQIEKHNHDGLKLNAITSVCPRDIAIKHARRLDEERRQEKIRSKLHGIPIIIKVKTTSTSARHRRLTGTGRYRDWPRLGYDYIRRLSRRRVFESQEECSSGRQGAHQNSSRLNCMTLTSSKLLEAGVIVLGKGNLTVSPPCIVPLFSNQTLHVANKKQGVLWTQVCCFSFLSPFIFHVCFCHLQFRFCKKGFMLMDSGASRSNNTPVGWSAYGGQALSPYIRKDLKDEDQPVCYTLDPRNRLHRN